MLKFKLIYTEYKDICLVAIALILFEYCKIKEGYFFWDSQYIYLVDSRYEIVNHVIKLRWYFKDIVKLL